MKVQWEEMEKEGDRMGDRPGGVEKRGGGVGGC